MRYYILIIAAAVFASCGKKNQGEFLPKVGDITETVFASGSLEAKDRYNLTAQSEGYLQEVRVDDGDSIKEGQVLAVIENVQNDANAEAARAQLAIAEFNLTSNAPAIKDATTNLELAEAKLAQEKKQLDRYKSLREKGSVSALELENQQLSYRNAEANVESLREKLNLLRQQAKQNEITQSAQNRINATNSGFNQLLALSDGKVIKRSKQAGDYVRKGDVIAIIANESSIIARLNVDENSISKIKPGQLVHVRLNVLKDTVFNAHVYEVYPLFDDATQSFLVDVKFDQQPPFTIVGTQLEANIIIGKKDQVMLIPRTYLSFSNTVNVKGEEEPRKVEVGIKSTEWVEILSGLKSEETLLPLKK